LLLLLLVQCLLLLVLLNSLHLQLQPGRHPALVLLSAVVWPPNL
jgi:hypothetical protein